MSESLKKRSKVHCYYVDDAKELGSTNKAVILYNFRFWLDTAQANGKHSHDGFTWIYNSIAALSILFPEISERQIRRCLKEMAQNGILLTGNYNKIAYDRTVWYTMPEYALEPLVSLDDSKNEEKSELNENALEPLVSPNRRSARMEAPIRALRSADPRAPIPDIRSNIRTDNKDLKHLSENAVSEPAPESHYFNLFWLNMALGKFHKKAAVDAFHKLFKRMNDPESFVGMLIDDTKKRHANNQRNIELLHPASYLNGERWTDPYTVGKGEDLSRDDTDWHKNPGRTFG